MKENNLILITNEIEKLNLTLGCWEEKINLLDNDNLRKVLDNIRWESDTVVNIGKKICS